jgi:DMSO reductase iron-sulfur subunit
MSLPLLERAQEDGVTYVLTPLPKRVRNAAPSERLHAIAPLPAAPRIPEGGLQPEEQYRFHFDMTTCVGCKCCVVACNEQNGNPAEINWRRVGEIEGGWYPETKRLYLSMGCNHCLEPTCLIGCPVDAYRKDPETGIVLHSAETCIGCQYCTWNCSYGVPQYNPERGVVGKCDMCYGRLSEGREPACVNACPTGSIKIEIVKVAEWREAYAATANAPGLPSADDSFSTTRITRPDSLPPNTSKVDSYRVRPEDPHWPLVVMTVLTQLSVGALAAIWLRQLLGGAMQLGSAALASLAVGAVALSASTLHLGRPAHAYRALKMWKRSWLSREVLMFSLFSFVAALYAGMLWFRLPGSAAFGGLTAALGILGVTASACIYLVRARPAWNTKRTVAEFYLSATLLGPLFAASLGVTEKRLLWVTVAAAIAQLFNMASKFLWLTRSDVFELQASARLFSTALASGLQMRVALLICGGIVLPLLLPGRITISIALAVALAGEFLGRYLFFVSVVPKNMAAAYLAGKKRAA